MSVDVSVPSLSALNLGGDGQITVTGIGAPQLTVRVSGAGLLSAAGTVTRLPGRSDGVEQDGCLPDENGVGAENQYRVVAAGA
jgi:hypothetical protein